MNNIKILTIHSEDRDINKWPQPNEFEVFLPDNYSSIESINLLNISITNNFYNISEYLFNNYLPYTLSPTIPKPTDISCILIPDGFYTPDNLAYFLNDLLQPEKIHVVYHTIKNKFLFLSDSSFSLDFSNIYYTDILCKNKKFLNVDKIKKQYDHWGIGYNLGFDKQIYNSSHNKLLDPTSKSNTHEVNNFDICLNYPPISFNTNGCQYIYSPNQIDLNTNNTIYMEVDKYNYCDEIMPYQYRSNSLYCNDYNSTINSFFAKIAFLTQYSTMGKIMTATRNDGYITAGHLKCSNQIDKLNKLKFKFRYHNGDLVDFTDINFNFTLEFILKCFK